MTGYRVTLAAAIALAWQVAAPLCAAEKASTVTCDGSTIEGAISFPGPGNGSAGAARELVWIMMNYPGYEKKSQGLFTKEGRVISKVSIENDAGDARTIYFDITSWRRH